MQKTRRIKTLLFVLSLVLIAAIALTGCDGIKKAPVPNPGSESTSLGAGEKTFSLVVTDWENNTESFEIHTDQSTVGEALLELGLLEGEEGPYGLYVKTVNGITADYDINGTYWAFYINGEYALSGVDVTEIAENAEYALRVEK